jgi:hypothetical protein
LPDFNGIASSESSTPLRATVTIVLVAVLLAAIAWLAFVLPPYWD